MGHFRENRNLFSFVNPLTYRRFLDPYFKVFWDGVKQILLIFFHRGIRNKKVLKGQECSGIDCLKIFWVRCKKTTGGGEAKESRKNSYYYRLGKKGPFFLVVGPLKKNFLVGLILLLNYFFAYRITFCAPCRRFWQSLPVSRARSPK